MKMLHNPDGVTESNNEDIYKDLIFHPNFQLVDGGRRIKLTGDVPENIQYGLIQYTKNLLALPKCNWFKMRVEELPVGSFIMFGLNKCCKEFGGPIWDRLSSLRYCSDTGGIFSKGVGSRSDYPYGEGDEIICLLEKSFPDRSLVNFLKNGKLVGRQWVYIERDNLYATIGINKGPASLTVEWPGEESLEPTIKQDSISNWIGCKHIELIDEDNTASVIKEDLDDDHEAFSVQSPRSFNKDFTYFEITLLRRMDARCGPCIGVTAPVFNKYLATGWDSFTFGYHGDEGAILHETPESFIEVNDDWKCNLGDRIGVGIVFPKMISTISIYDIQPVMIYITKNGQYLHHKCVLQPRGGFYPTLSLVKKDASTDFRIGIATRSDPLDSTTLDEEICNCCFSLQHSAIVYNKKTGPKVDACKSGDTIGCYMISRSRNGKDFKISVYINDIIVGIQTIENRAGLNVYPSIVFGQSKLNVNMKWLQKKRLLLTTKYLKSWVIPSKNVLVNKNMLKMMIPPTNSDSVVCHSSVPVSKNDVFYMEFKLTEQNETGNFPKVGVRSLSSVQDENSVEVMFKPKECVIGDIIGCNVTITEDRSYPFAALIQFYKNNAVQYKKLVDMTSHGLCFAIEFRAAGESVLLNFNAKIPINLPSLDFKELKHSEQSSAKQNSHEKEELADDDRLQSNIEKYIIGKSLKIYPTSLKLEKRYIQNQCKLTRSSSNVIENNMVDKGKNNLLINFSIVFKLYFNTDMVPIASQYKQEKDCWNANAFFALKNYYNYQGSAVFISHTNFDIQKVKCIFHKLSTENCFVDMSIWHPEDDNKKKIINSSDIVIFCLSNTSLKDKHQQTELKWISKAGIPIIPVLLEDVPWPPGGHLNDQKKFFIRYDHIKLKFSDINSDSDVLSKYIHQY
ncbi:hypothetical protein KUTeg_013852 [Tegillarca granosa]|uniref:TIR domain-containing protein n=1 Tax=Tegillarca granosa TaxID=220873 RepID=A0ABQ9EUW6_TEGGR|nr:hypothetical protein KUTeg_013852 [Tegillarca granosa]